MKIATQSRHGGSEVLEIRDVPIWKYCVNWSSRALSGP